MPVPDGQQAAMQLPQGLNATEVTLPSRNLCHYITDTELDRLGEMRKDFVMEVCLASVGILAGSLIPAYDGFARFGAKNNPATQTDLLSMMLCFTALVVAVLTGFQWFQKSKSHTHIVDEIRGRDKVPVKLISDE